MCPLWHLCRSSWGLIVNPTLRVCMSPLYEVCMVNIYGRHRHNTMDTWHLGEEKMPSFFSISSMNSQVSWVAAKRTQRGRKYSSMGKKVDCVAVTYLLPTMSFSGASSLAIRASECCMELGSAATIV